MIGFYHFNNIKQSKYNHTFEKEVAIKLLKQNEYYKFFLRQLVVIFIKIQVFCFKTALKYQTFKFKKSKNYIQRKIFENYYNIEEVLKNLRSKNIIIDKKNILLECKILQITVHGF